MNIFIDSHNVGIPFGFVHVVVLDIHEHAYRDYLNDRSGYVIGQMREFNWTIVEERIKRCEKILEIMK